jgi:hypothetical protein
VHFYHLRFLTTSSFAINLLQTRTLLMCCFLYVCMEWLAFLPVYRPWSSQAEILKNIGLSFLRNGKLQRITSKNINSAKSETHNPSPSRKIWGKKKAAKPKDRKVNKKNISRQMKTKVIGRNSSWKGTSRLLVKKNTAYFWTDIRWGTDSTCSV